MSININKRHKVINLNVTKHVPIVYANKYFFKNLNEY